MAAATLVASAVDESETFHKPPFYTFNGAANAMDNSGVQDIFTLNVAGLKRIALRFTVATNALAAFVVSALVNPLDSTYITLASTAGDYTVPRGVLVGASGDLTTLAVGSGWLILDVEGFAVIKIGANSSAAGGSTLALQGGGSASGRGA